MDQLRNVITGRASRSSSSDLYSYLQPAHVFMVQQRQRRTLQVLRREGYSRIQGLSILELGCGRGGILQEYLNFGALPANLHGCDLWPNRLIEARMRLPHLPLACANGQNLPYPSSSFDIVMQYTVFTSILDERLRVDLAKEMMRVLRPGGMILWYDFWVNPTNPDTRGIRPAEIRRLFPKCHHNFHRITLAPPIARRLVPISWIACQILENLILFNSHYLAVIKPI